MYVKPTTTEEKLIDLVKELASHLEDVYLCNGFGDDEGQEMCDRAFKFAEKADKRRNKIYKEKGE